jgi:hypothetical protein
MVKHAIDPDVQRIAAPAPMGAGYANRSDVTVLALPRGDTPVARGAKWHRQDELHAVYNKNHFHFYSL